MMYGQTVYSELAPGLLAIHRSYLNENTWVLINTTGQPFDLSVNTGEPLRPLIGALDANDSGGFAIKPWGASAFDVLPLVGKSEAH